MGSPPRTLVAALLLLAGSAGALAPDCAPRSPPATGVGAAAARNDGEGEDAGPCATRRGVLASSGALLASAALPLALPLPAAAAAAAAAAPFLRGVATLPEGGGDGAPSLPPGAALYVTARPNRPDNVPRAILDGTRGKPPPVLAARFQDPSFPFRFALDGTNLTPEGAAAAEAGGTDGASAAAAAPPQASSPPWWAEEDLVVSARLDSDGIAATRDPTDLVGRGFYRPPGGGEVAVELQGRGAFGKAVTGKK